LKQGVFHGKRINLYIVLEKKHSVIAAIVAIPLSILCITLSIGTNNNNLGIYLSKVQILGFAICVFKSLK